MPPKVYCPLFVTWLKGKKKHLRGCIGSFEPLNLSKNLKEFALLSAFKDDRFDPIMGKELVELQVSISLLVRFSKRPLKNPLDWTVGKHGVSLEIKDKDGEVYESTFLPCVAKEQKWD